MKQKKQSVYVTEYDMEKLHFLLSQRAKDDFIELRDRLEQVNVISGKDIPHDIITVNSKIRVQDMNTGDEWALRVVFPKDENFRQGRVSVTRPFGAALLGSRVGDEVVWGMVSERVKFKIKVLKMIYQPEQFGQYTLK